MTFCVTPTVHNFDLKLGQDFIPYKRYFLTELTFRVKVAIEGGSAAKNIYNVSFTMYFDKFSYFSGLCGTRKIRQSSRN